MDGVVSSTALDIHKLIFESDERIREMIRRTKEEEEEEEEEAMAFDDCDEDDEDDTLERLSREEYDHFRCTNCGSRNSRCRSSRITWYSHCNYEQKFIFPG